MPNTTVEYTNINDARIYAESIIKTIAEPLVVLDSELRVVTANKAFNEFFRVTQEETEHKLIYQLGSGQWNVDVLRELLEKVIPSNEQFEKYIVDYDFPGIGRKIMMLNGRRISQEGGRRRLILLVIEDVTERKLAEMALRESEEKYRNLVQGINSVIIRLDSEGKIVFLNRFAEKVFGYKEEEVIHKKIVDTLIPQKDERGNDLAAMFEDVLRNPERYYIQETEGLRKNGQRIWFQWSAKETRGQNNKVTSILIDGNDVTSLHATKEKLERRETEYNELRKAQEALRQSEERYRLLFNSIDEGFCVVEVLFDKHNKPVDYRFLKVNSAFERQTGLHEVQGKRIRELSPSHEEYWFEIYGRIALTGKPERFVNEAKALHRWYDVFAFHIGGQESRKVGILFHDINARVKADETLRRNEYELRTLVDNSPDLIFRMNRQMQYVYVNPAYERLTGISKEQFVGKANSQLGMSQQQVEFWQSEMGRAIESGHERSVEFDLTSLFGKRYFSARLIPEFATSGLVDTVLVIARDITERKRAEEQIRYISFHDEVTGLFNRAFYEEEIRRVDTERDLPISIIMSDVNNLKLSNDVFGHDEGDKLLKTIADCIRKACRQSDIVARWGGDEFAVILPKTDYSTAEEICNRIGQIARESKGTIVQPSLAAGIATKENKNQNIYQIIRQAEERMYDHKLSHSKENQEMVISRLLERTRERIKDYTPHIERSNELADRFCKELELSEEQMKDLHMLIDLHDIGDAVIPQEILTKPGRLNGEEWNIMKKHAEAGFRITKTHADTARISDEVLSHSEYWDGSGYPRGLKGTEIPYLSRIFLIIDAYVVMTHPRPYARTFTQDEAIAELRRNSGKQFDPELTEAFIKVLTGAAKEKTLV